MVENREARSENIEHDIVIVITATVNVTVTASGLQFITVTIGHDHFNSAFCILHFANTHTHTYIIHFRCASSRGRFGGLLQEGCSRSCGYHLVYNYFV